VVIPVLSLLIVLSFTHRLDCGGEPPAVSECVYVCVCVCVCVYPFNARANVIV
jgi:hypothetical protein